MDLVVFKAFLSTARYCFKANPQLYIKVHLHCTEHMNMCSVVVFSFFNNTKEREMHPEPTGGLVWWHSSLYIISTREIQNQI